ncbi:MAG: hypothetical protein K0R18_375 [Bacillales bacterium]|nr:hypothetical protein [Bacillales bacterium]
MKQVVIGMKDGKPYVVAAPKNVEVVFKAEKKATFKKRFKTMVYILKTRWSQ